MKKYIFTLLFIGSLSINAQTVNDIKIEEIPARYVTLIFKMKGLSAYDIDVSLDYGQMNKLKDKNGHIIGDNGERMKFNGVVSALNFLEKKGFKLITNYLNWTPTFTVIFENENYKKTN